MRAQSVVDKENVETLNIEGNAMASQQNIKSAEKTYESFLNFMKWGTIVSVGLGALVVILISS